MTHFKVFLKKYYAQYQSNESKAKKIVTLLQKKTTLDIAACNFSMYLIKLSRPEFQKTVASFTKSTSQRTRKGMKSAYPNNFTSMNNLCPRFKAIQGKKKEAINQGLLFAHDTYTPV